MNKSLLADELIQSRNEFLSGKKSVDLLSILLKVFPNIGSNVFVINWIPEQAEDIFVLLVDGKEIIEMEILRSSPDAKLVRTDVLTIADYLKNNPFLSKIIRRKLDVAVQLAKSQPA